ncbi:MAG: putative zinc-binding metallopeptidase [Dehalogenimonas sp.]
MIPGNLTRKELSPSQAGLLSTRIADLQLSIRGTRLDSLLRQLYRELETSGLANFKPEAYLSDEWGCPAGVPVIGIPFYLASPDLCELECRFTGVEAESDDEIMMYLRHEAGHAFNYAHKLYEQAEWSKIFGDYKSAYRETYGVVPFSSKFVRHISGWYAQKHPDDDFAETFAVWLTPRSEWVKVYEGTHALKKLLYVDKVAKRHNHQPIVVSKRALDTPVEEITMTLDSWYRTFSEHSHEKQITNPILDEDLKRAFPDVIGELAAVVIGREKIQLLYEINRWTGLERHVVSDLVEELIKRIETLGLKIEPESKEADLKTFAIIATTLATNFLCRGTFIE